MSQQYKADDWPLTGFLRQADLIGQAAVTSEQAEANRASGKGIKRPRDRRIGKLPFSSPTLWRRIKSGDFPTPVKLSKHITAWRVEDVRAWMLARGANHE